MKPMSDYAKKKEMERSYRYYIKTVSSIPDFIKRKLAQMPNNKGYIWRGMYCFGDLRAERDGPLVMFEKRGDTLVIHEWSDTHYRVFTKVGQNRKTLVHSASRNLKTIDSGGLMDYVTIGKKSAKTRR